MTNSPKKMSQLDKIQQTSEAIWNTQYNHLPDGIYKTICYGKDMREAYDILKAGQAMVSHEFNYLSVISAKFIGLSRDKQAWLFECLTDIIYIGDVHPDTGKIVE